MDLLLVDNQQLFFSIIISTFFITIGVFGNVTSCIIFNSKEFKKQPVTVCLTASCLMNLVTILYLPVIMFSKLWENDSINCKVINGIFGTILRIQSWMVTIGSLDRLITILKKGGFVYKNRIIFKMMGMLLIVIIICMLISPEIYYLDVVHDETSNISYCSFALNNNFDLILVYYKIEYFLMRVGLPFIIMTISSKSIINKLEELKKKLFKNKN